MKKLVIQILIMIFALVSGTNSQTFFSEIWGNAGFALSLPKLYTLDTEAAFSEPVDEYILNSSTTGAFGLYAGLKVKLFEINEHVYFGPSIYIQKILAGTELIMFENPIDANNYQFLSNEVKHTISDLNINGDFYFKIPSRERELFVGAGVGIHSVKFKTALDIGLGEEAYWREIANFPGEGSYSFDEPYPKIDDSETKIGLNLIAKIKLIQNLFLEGRFEFVSGLNQFRLTASYKLWDRKKIEE